MTEEGFGHNYNTEKIEPTCKDKGYIKHTCITCADTYVETYIDATGKHEYAETVVEPTNTTKGYTLHQCKVCGDEYKDNFVDVTKKDDEKNDENKNENSSSPVKDKNFYNVTRYDDDINLLDAQQILRYALGIDKSHIKYTLKDAQACLKIALGIK